MRATLGCCLIWTREQATSIWPIILTLSLDSLLDQAAIASIDRRLPAPCGMLHAACCTHRREQCPTSCELPRFDCGIGISSLDNQISALNRRSCSGTQSLPQSSSNVPHPYPPQCTTPLSPSHSWQWSSIRSSRDDVAMIAAAAAAAATPKVPRCNADAISVRSAAAAAAVATTSRHVARCLDATMAEPIVTQVRCSRRRRLTQCRSPLGGAAPDAAGGKWRGISEVPANFSTPCNTRHSLA